MKYAREVIELMAAHPGVEFRMAQIVRYVVQGREVSPRRRNAVREGVRRVLLELRGTGQVAFIEHGEKSGFYVWRGRLQHEVLENCHANCHN